MKKLLILLGFINFTSVFLSQNGKNTLAFSNSINTIYKRNGVFKYFDENFGNSLHTEFNLTYFRTVFEREKVQIKLGAFVNCEFLKLRLKYNPFSDNQSKRVINNWIVFPGISTAIFFPLNSKLDYNIVFNQSFGKLTFSTETHNNHKQSSNEFNNDIFTKTNVLTGFSYKIYEQENKMLKVNFGIGTDLYSSNRIFLYRYYTNYGLNYSF